ncbi:DMT family transporter [Angustibacter luteus]|uniref:DMT family transporter n=1 Tax=Angustibacter luteus TaxID=658456 RepID=A0ABW1JKD1_9ACTN
MSRRAVLLFAGLSIAWGIPYLLIKIAVEELSPLTLVFARTALAAVLLLPVAIARGWVRPVLARWPKLLVFTAVEITVPWLLLSRAEQHLSSSLTALLVAAVPLVGVGVAMVTGRREQLGRLGGLGLLVGIAGVGLLVGVDVSGSQWSAVAEMGVVVVGYAFGAALLARWFSDVPGPGVVALSLTAAALGYLPFAVPGLPSTMPSGRVVLAVVLLALVSTAAAFLLLVALVGEIGPVRATTITYVNPAVAVVAGALVLGEQVTVWTLGGFALVIAGSVLVNRRQPAQEVLDESAPCPAPVTAAT